MRALAAVPTVLFTLTLAGCQGDRASAAKSGDDPWSAPLPEGRDVPAAPQVDGISPAFASPAMTVRIAGSGFGSDASAVAVTFGGVPAMPLSVSESEIAVKPVAGGQAADGTVDVVVTVGGMPANAVTMRLGARGDRETIDTAPPESVGDVARLGDDSLLVTDPVGDQIHRIDADGFVRKVATLPDPARIAIAPDGTVLVLGKTTVWSLAGDSIAVWRAGTSWADAVSANGELFALANYGMAIERVGADGVTAGTIGLDACAGAGSITAMDGTLFIASGATLCSVDPATGAETAIPLHGAQVWNLASLEPAGEALLASGIFGSGPAAAIISVAGEVQTVLSTSFGYPRAAVLAAGDIVLGMSEGNVVQMGATSRKLLATRVRDLGSFRADGSSYLVTGGWTLPFLAELRQDGAYRVIVTGTTPSMWTHVEREGDGFVVAAYDQAAVLRIAADGTISTLIDHSAIGPVASFGRMDGEFLLSSYGPDIARYAADGSMLDAKHVTAEGSAVFGIAIVGSRMFAAAGDRVIEADARTGGAAVTRTQPVDGLLGIGADSQGRLYVADGNGSGDIFLLEGSAFVKIGHAGSALSIDIDADGAVLVADTNAMPYRMLP